MGVMTDDQCLMASALMSEWGYGLLLQKLFNPIEACIWLLLCQLSFIVQFCTIMLLHRPSNFITHHSRDYQLNNTFKNRLLHKCYFWFCLDGSLHRASTYLTGLSLKI